MQVYRVETSNGRGIYNGNFYGSDWCAEYSVNAHPLPEHDAAMAPHWADFQALWDREIFFGFTGWAQLRAWLYKREWRDKLTELGCRVSIYEVPDGFALIGDTQVGFVRSRAQRITTLGLF